MASSIREGDRVLVGRKILTIDPVFAAALEPGDEVLGVASTGVLRRIPRSVSVLVDDAISQAVEAFEQLAFVSPEKINNFFQIASDLLANDQIFSIIKQANESDVSDAMQRGRSTTRLLLDAHMRKGMIEAFDMWHVSEVERSSLLETTQHNGWKVEQFTAPLGVVGFVFEGRPNVFADATGVLKSGNTVAFRIGSDALQTARAIMSTIVEPALASAGLPVNSVVLIDSREHAAGWAMFSDPRIALAVARGSGQAVAELGSIAKQAGISVSLHGTGGAWMLVGESADTERLASVVEHSLDRKVCNTLNVVCIVRQRADEFLKVVVGAAQKAANIRGTSPIIHVVGDVSVPIQNPELFRVENENDLSVEFEWDSSPEFHVVIVDDLRHAIELFNRYSPQFVVSVISEDDADHTEVWSGCNAPFFGDGFTRWVDGQFALLRPELGLSNWENGRLFARSGVLSGDSVFTVRLRVSQSTNDLHR